MVFGQARANNFLFEDGMILTNSLPEAGGDAGAIRIVAPTLNPNNNGRIGSNALGTGNGGSIDLQVNQLTLTKGSQIATTTGGSGRGGNITITANSNILIATPNESGAPSALVADSFGTTGNAGTIQVITPVLHLDDGARIQSVTLGEGHAGTVDLQVERLTLRGGSQVATATLGAGHGGNLIIIAHESILIAGRDNRHGFPSLLSASALEGAMGNVGTIRVTTPVLTINDGGQIVNINTGKGHPGTVDLQVNQFVLTGGGQIGVVTFGAGDGGDLTINALESVLIAGQGQDGIVSGLGTSSLERATGNAGAIRIITPILEISDGGDIENDTQGPGNAGIIDFQVGRLILTGGSQVSTGTTGLGQGGNITITATEAVLIAGYGPRGHPAGFFASSEEGTTGHAGTIQITAPTLEIQGGGLIGSGAFGQGNAGEVDIQVDHLILSGGGRIIAPNYGSSQGGNIMVIATAAVDITGQDEKGFRSGLLVSAAEGVGDAGDVTVTTPRLTLADSGVISGQSDKTTGGNITLNADHLKMFDDSISSTAFGDVPGSDGGNVTLNSINIVALNGSTITARANEGQGGNITVNAEVFLHDAADTAQVLNASSRVIGNDGTVELNAPTIDLSGSLVAAETHYLDATAQLSQRCGGEELGERSRFIVQGRGALPPAPGDPATAPLGQCGPGALALAAPAATTDAPPPPRAARAPRVVEFGFNDR